jgi:putative transposase
LVKSHKIAESTVSILIGISTRTLQNWRRFGLTDKRKGSSRFVPHRLTEEEEEQLYQVATSERMMNLTPEQIVAIMAFENKYIASESTLYRVLRKRKALTHRQESKKPCERHPYTQMEVTGPNQVWAWDITWLSTDVRGQFKYAYSIIDIFDKSIVCWTIEDYESDDHAKHLFSRACRNKHVRPEIVHADNGHPMRGASLGTYLDSLKISRSHSRPRVSNDNAHIEAWHKTLKYRVGYPKVLPSLHFAREWFAKFVDWYNNEHLHSSLGYVTPHQRRSGEAEAIYQARDKGIQEAKARNPHRWRQGKIKVWASLPVHFNYRPLKKSA